MQAWCVRLSPRAPQHFHDASRASLPSPMRVTTRWVSPLQLPAPTGFIHTVRFSAFQSTATPRRRDIARCVLTLFDLGDFWSDLARTTVCARSTRALSDFRSLSLLLVSSHLINPIINLGWKKNQFNSRLATQSAALVQHGVSAKAGPAKAKAARAPVRAAAASSSSSSSSSEDSSTRRQALMGGVAAATCAMLPAGPALALSGFSIVKDTRDGYQFYYPVGWQEITVDGQDAVFKDIIEPLESVALNIYPTSRESLAEIGSPDEVAKTLVAKALAIPGAQAKVLKTAQRKDKEGHLYYALEYVTKTNSYERHALTTVTITQGKFYTLTTGSSERRWSKMKDRLQVVTDSFNVYY